MLRALTKALLLNQCLAKGETTEERPIISWIKTLDYLVQGARGSQFLGEYGGTFNLLEGYGCNCHAVISGKTGSGRPVDELDKERFSKGGLHFLWNPDKTSNRHASNIYPVQSASRRILTMVARSARSTSLTLLILTFLLIRKFLFSDADHASFRCPTYLDSCSRSVCECDAQLMNSVTELLLNNPNINPWDHNNNFDYDQSKCIKGPRKYVETDHQVNVRPLLPRINYKSSAVEM